MRRWMMGVTMLGLAAGWGAARLATKPVLPAPAPTGEMENLLAIEVEPMAASQRGDKRAMTLSVVVRSRFEGAMTMRHSMELVDDRGRAMMQPVVSAPVAMPGKGAHESRMDTPDKLKKGYYLVRVIAAATDGNRDAIEVTEVPLRVERGSIDMVSIDEFYQKSDARLGVPL